MSFSRFDAELFIDPPKQYRPLRMVHGFDKFDKVLPNGPHFIGEAEIDEGLDRFLALGYGGAVVNVGFRDYLKSERQWQVYRRGLLAAIQRDMTLWWYDEKGYPSGTAGGLVTRAHPEFASLGLACYHVYASGPVNVVFPRPANCRATVWVGAVQGNLRQVCRQQFLDLREHVDAAGTLRWSPLVGDWTVLYMAERVNPAKMIASGDKEELRHYVNLLDPNVTAEFIRITHEAYYRETPPELWKRFRAIFTDEPALESAYGAGTLPADHPDQDHPPFVPWVGTFPATFQKAKGYDLRPSLYALFCSETEEAGYIRQDFYEVMTQLYVDSYFGQIATWCKAHGIASSGHVLNEEWLGTQVACHGDLFAALRRLDVPGIDLLAVDPVSMLNGLGFMTAKQAGSVAHLIGAEEVHCESSGRLSLAHRIGQGNLLHVMGVNQITSYWGIDVIDEKQYLAYNDYMGRLALFLRGGRHVCDVALLYPIRAAWATFVPHSPLASANIDSPTINAQLDRLGGNGYAQPVRDLIQSQIDLDIIDEQAILEARIADGRLCVAQERYRIVVIPSADTMGVAAAEKLAEFGRAGGQVFFIDGLPVRGESVVATVRLQSAIAGLVASGCARTVALEQLPPAVRTAGADDFTLATPDRDVLYTHRQVDGHDVYFVINAAASARRICPRLRVPGPYVLYRPLTGTTGNLSVSGEIYLEGFEGVFLVIPAGMEKP